MDSNRSPRKFKFKPKPPKQTQQQDSIQKENSTGQSSTKADDSSSKASDQLEELHSGTEQSLTKAHDSSSNAPQPEQLHYGTEQSSTKAHDSSSKAPQQAEIHFGTEQSSTKAHDSSSNAPQPEQVHYGTELSSTKAHSSSSKAPQQAELHSGTGKSSTKAHDSSSKAPQQEELHYGLTNADSSSSTEKNNFPWDVNSNYPMIWPWKNPDGVDLGDIVPPDKYDENTINCAAELGLLEKNDKPQMIMFQLPHHLLKQQKDDNVTASSSGIPTNAKGKGKEKEKTLVDDQEEAGGRRCKLLVYKSGNVKMKIGDDIWDVSPGVNRRFCQDVVAINTGDKYCARLGKVDKNAVVSLDLDFF